MKLTLAKVLARTYKVHVASRSCSVFNSLPTSGDLCHLLITFANSLEPDQARQNVGPALEPNCLTVLIKKSSIQRVKYGTIIIKCEGIIKAILENPKADQNTLFRRNVFLNHLECPFSQ